MSSASYQKKQATAMYEQWKRSRYDDLDSAYKSYSPAKGRAWRYCQNLCNELGGTGLRVVSRTIPKFTAGFTFELEGQKHYMHITSSYDQHVPVND